MAFDLGQARGEIIIDARGATRGVQQAQTALNGLSQSTQTVGFGLSALGQSLIGIGGAATLGIGAAVREAGNFEEALANVATISDDVAAKTDFFGQQILRVASESNRSAADLADAFYDIVSAAFTGSQGLLVLETAAMAANAGLTTTTTAANILTSIVNAGVVPGITAATITLEDLTKINDTLFETVNRGVFTYEQLAMALGDSLPLAAGLGVNLEELGASFALITRNGQTASEASTQINAVLSALLKPSDTLTQVLTGLGFETGSAAIESLGFAGALEAIEQAITASGGEIDDFSGNIRAVRGILGLTNSTAGEFSYEVDRIRDSVGATNNALEQQQKTFNFAVTSLRNALERLAISVGTTLLPILTRAVNFLTRVVKRFDEIPEPVKAVIAVIVGLGGAFAVALGVIAIFASQLIAIAAAFNLIRKNGLGLRGVLGGLLGPVESLGNGVSSLTTASGGAARSTGFLGRILGSFSRPATQSSARIREMVSEIRQLEKATPRSTPKITAMGRSLGLVQSSLRTIPNGFSKLSGSLVGLPRLLAPIPAALDKLVAPATALADPLKKIGAGFRGINSITPDLPARLSAIYKPLNALVPTVIALGDPLKNLGSGFRGINSVAADLPGRLSAIEAPLRQLAPVFPALVDPVSKVGKGFRGISSVSADLPARLNAIDAPLQSLTPTLAAISKYARDTGLGFSRMKRGLTDLPALLPPMVAPLQQLTPPMVALSESAAKVGSGFKGVANGVRELGKADIPLLTTKINDIGTALVDFEKKTGDAPKSFAKIGTASRNMAKAFPIIADTAPQVAKNLNAMSIPMRLLDKSMGNAPANIYSMSQAFASMNRVIPSLTTPLGRVAKQVEQIGTKIGDSGNQFLNWSKGFKGIADYAPTIAPQLPVISDALGRMAVSAKAAAPEMTLLGFAFNDIDNATKGIGNKLGPFVGQIEAIGLAASNAARDLPKFADDIFNLAASFDLLGQSLKGKSTSIANTAASLTKLKTAVDGLASTAPLTAVTTSLVDFVNKVDEPLYRISETALVAAPNIDNLSTSFSRMGTTLPAISQSLPALANGMNAFGASIKNVNVDRVKRLGSEIFTLTYSIEAKAPRKLLALADATSAFGKALSAKGLEKVAALSKAMGQISSASNVASGTLLGMSRSIPTLVAEIGLLSQGFTLLTAAIGKAEVALVAFTGSTAAAAAAAASLNTSLRAAASTDVARTIDAVTDATTGGGVAIANYGDDVAEATVALSRARGEGIGVAKSLGSTSKVVSSVADGVEGVGIATSAANSRLSKFKNLIAETGAQQQKLFITPQPSPFTVAAARQTRRLIDSVVSYSKKAINPQAIQAKIVRRITSGIQDASVAQLALAATSEASAARSVKSNKRITKSVRDVVRSFASGVASVKKIGFPGQKNVRDAVSTIAKAQSSILTNIKSTTKKIIAARKKSIAVVAGSSAAEVFAGIPMPGSAIVDFGDRKSFLPPLDEKKFKKSSESTRKSFELIRKSTKSASLSIAKYAKFASIATIAGFAKGSVAVADAAQKQNLAIKAITLAATGGNLAFLRLGKSAVTAGAKAAVSVKNWRALGSAIGAVGLFGGRSIARLGLTVGRLGKGLAGIGLLGGKSIARLGASVAKAVIPFKLIGRWLNIWRLGFKALLLPLKATIFLIKGLVSAIFFLLSPLGLIIATLGFFAVAFTQNWFGIRDKVTAAIDGIVDRVTGFIDIIKAAARISKINSDELAGFGGLNQVNLRQTSIASFTRTLAASLGLSQDAADDLNYAIVRLVANISGLRGVARKAEISLGRVFGFIFAPGIASGQLPAIENFQLIFRYLTDVFGSNVANQIIGGAQQFRLALIDLSNAIDEVFGGGTSGDIASFFTIEGFLIATTDAARKFVRFIRFQVIPVVGKLIAVFLKVAAVITKSIAAFVRGDYEGAFRTLGQGIRDGLSAVISSLLDLPWGTIYENAKSLITSAFRAGFAIGTVLISFVPELASNIWGAAGDAFNWLRGKILGNDGPVGDNTGISQAGNLLIPIGTVVLNALAALGGVIAGVASDFNNWLMTKIFGSDYSENQELPQNIGTVVLDGIVTFGTNIKPWVENGIGKLKEWFTPLYDAVVVDAGEITVEGTPKIGASNPAEDDKFAVTLLTRLMSAIGRAVSSAGTWVVPALEWITDLLESLTNWMLMVDFDEAQIAAFGVKVGGFIRDAIQRAAGAANDAVTDEDILQGGGYTAIANSIIGQDVAAKGPILTLGERLIKSIIDLIILGIASPAVRIVFSLKLIAAIGSFLGGVILGAIANIDVDLDEETAGEALRRAGKKAGVQFLIWYIEGLQSVASATPIIGFAFDTAFGGIFDQAIEDLEVLRDSFNTPAGADLGLDPITVPIEVEAEPTAQVSGPIKIRPGGGGGIRAQLFAIDPRDQRVFEGGALAEFGSLLGSITEKLGAESEKQPVDIPAIKASFGQLFSERNERADTEIALLGVRLISRLGEEISSGPSRSRINVAMISVVRAAALAAAAMSTMFVSTGQRLADGLAIGMYSRASAVIQAARYLANSANVAFQTEMQMRSPSRVWASYGEYMGEGLAIGMQASGQIVARASDVLAAMATPTPVPYESLTGIGARTAASGGPVFNNAVIYMPNAETAEAVATYFMNYSRSRW